jgi:hypothetical protein
VRMNEAMILGVVPARSYVSAVRQKTSTENGSLLEKNYPTTTGREVNVPIGTRPKDAEASTRSRSQMG